MDRLSSDHAAFPPSQPHCETSARRTGHITRRTVLQSVMYWLPRLTDSGRIFIENGSEKRFRVRMRAGKRALEDIQIDGLVLNQRRREAEPKVNEHLPRHDQSALCRCIWAYQFRWSIWHSISVTPQGGETRKEYGYTFEGAPDEQRYWST